MRKLGIGAAAGALLAFFLDPRSGRRRRHGLRDRARGSFHRGLRKTRHLARGLIAEAYGLKQKARHRHEVPKEQPNDATLVAKVESEVLRDADVPKGQINVNAESGVVVLRGQLERPELIAELEAKVRKVQGVLDVENLLHLPGTEAPMHQAHRS
jgi:osmotically-inducible protein OsmY